MRRPGRVTIAALMSVSLLKAAMGVAHAGDIPAQPETKNPAAKAPTSKQGASKAASSKTPKVGKLSWSILFSVSADEATLSPLGGKNYRLTMDNVDERTTWFTDRPIRHAGATPTARLIAGWNIGRDNFAEDPPNAALVVHEPNGGADTIVVELSSPIYDQANDQLTFTAKELAAEAELNTVHRDNADPLPTAPTTYSEVSLFIDDASTILVSQGTPSAASAAPSPAPSAGATPSASPTPVTSPSATASPSPSVTSSPSPSASTPSNSSPSSSSSTTSSSSGHSQDLFVNLSVDDWVYHLNIAAADDRDRARYIAKTKLNNSDLRYSNDDLIYSMPASLLISNFSDHHLDNCQSGIQLVSHKYVDSVIGV